MRRILAALILTACGGAPAVAPGGPAAPAAPAGAPAPVAGAPAPAGAPLSNTAAPSAVAASGRLPVGTGDFGSAGPTYIRGADEGERWMALCQARTDTDGDGKIEIRVGHHGELFGDGMELFLVLGGGMGTPIEALASRSADGRWLAVVRGGKVELVDAETGDFFELRGADAQSDGRPGAPHRAAMFAKDRLLYIRRTGGTGGTGGDDVLVVHDPATHAERELPVPGRLWRIDYNPDRLAHLYVIPRGQPFPALQTTLGGGECIGPAMSYSTYGNRGPKPTEHWIDLASGKEIAAASAEGTEIAVGDTLVRTPADGALYFGDEQIAPPACRAELIGAMPSPVRAIAICGEKKQAKILLLGKGLRQELASINRETDHYGGMHDRFDNTPRIACGSGLHCIATATNQYIDLKGGVAEYAWGSKLYVVNATMSSRKHTIIDVDTGARTPIKAADKRLGAGKYIVDYDFNLVDLETAKVLGKVKDAKRVSSQGRVLRGGADDTGPLRWDSP